MVLEIVTYKELMIKYPNAKEDLERLQQSKNQGLTGTRILCFLLGMGFMYILCFYFFISRSSCLV